jgi:hypothetical protein
LGVQDVRKKALRRSIRASVDALSILMHSQELKGTIVPTTTIVNLGLRLWDLPAIKKIKV